MRALLAALLVALWVGPAAGAEPWRDAGKVTEGLFDAQTELVLSGPAEALKDTARAQAAYRGELRATLRSAARKSDPAIGQALEAARRAARDNDQIALAAARGSV